MSESKIVVRLNKHWIFYVLFGFEARTKAIKLLMKNPIGIR